MTFHLFCVFCVTGWIVGDAVNHFKEGIKEDASKYLDLSSWIISIVNFLMTLIIYGPLVLCLYLGGFYD